MSAKEIVAVSKRQGEWAEYAPLTEQVAAAQLDVLISEGLVPRTTRRVHSQASHAAKQKLSDMFFTTERGVNQKRTLPLGKTVDQALTEYSTECKATKRGGYDPTRGGGDESIRKGKVDVSPGEITRKRDGKTTVERYHQMDVDLRSGKPSFVYLLQADERYEHNSTKGVIGVQVTSTLAAARVASAWKEEGNRKLHQDIRTFAMNELLTNPKYGIGEAKIKPTWVTSSKKGHKKELRKFKDVAEVFNNARLATVTYFDKSFIVSRKENIERLLAGDKSFQQATVENWKREQTRISLGVTQSSQVRPSITSRLYTPNATESEYQDIQRSNRLKAEKLDVLNVHVLGEIEMLKGLKDGSRYEIGHSAKYNVVLHTDPSRAKPSVKPDAAPHSGPVRVKASGNRRAYGRAKPKR